MIERALVRNIDTNNWSLLTDCIDVLVANDHGHVLSVIETAERRAQTEQLHAVGYVAYEASHAFDAKFPKRDIEIPLVCFALFASEKKLDSLVDLYSPVSASQDNWQLLLFINLMANYLLLHWLTDCCPVFCEMSCSIVLWLPSGPCQSTS